jgi:hypothetical protein
MRKLAALALAAAAACASPPAAPPPAPSSSMSAVKEARPGIPAGSTTVPAGAINVAWTSGSSPCGT